MATTFNPNIFNKPGVHSTGERNLYLLIASNGNKARSWTFRYQQHGKTCVLGLGPLHTVTFNEAKVKALELRRWLLQGKDLKAETARLKAANAPKLTFAECAERFIEAKSPEWTQPEARQAMGRDTDNLRRAGHWHAARRSRCDRARPENPDSDLVHQNRDRQPCSPAGRVCPRLGQVQGPALWRQSGSLGRASGEHAGAPGTHRPETPPPEPAVATGASIRRGAAPAQRASGQDDRTGNSLRQPVGRSARRLLVRVRP